MALKTVLTQLLRKWGIMSTEMQIAYESDQAIITENEKIYIDNPNNDNKEIKLKEIEETKKEININYAQIQNNIDNLYNLVFKNE